MKLVLCAGHRNSTCVLERRLVVLSGLVRVWRQCAFHCPTLWRMLSCVTAMLMEVHTSRA